ncbi:unnamed protein product, partial [Medioppia subpectinata]
MAQEVKHLKTELETTDDGEDVDEDNRQPQIYAKNSMDRFGDDLSQLLLSYLSLEDRFQCECVSKQFQRTVFVSVVDITLSDRFIQRLLNEKRSDTEMLATFAIKCSNIQTIDCRGITKDYEKRVPEVLGLLRDYCRRLRDIYCDWSYEMLATFGPLVTQIDAIICFNGSKAFNYCHRLSQLRIHSFNDIFDIRNDRSRVKNIRKFELISHSYYHNRRWPSFVAANQSIESLTVTSRTFRDEESVREMCGQLSRLTQLRELTLGLPLRSMVAVNPAVVSDSLRTIGVNCKQLKRLALNLCATTVQVLSLDSLSVFRRLKWLRLEVYAAIDDQLLEPLRHCKRLTQLGLKLNKMTPKVMTDLHQYCPRLHYLFIHDFNNIIDTECLSHISRLPALQTLVIECNADNDMAHEVKHLKTSLETTDDGEDVDEDNRQPQIYAKNSMDRFGDDLCQLLLSNLSLEDRFQCECVSKQFQRTVFESVVNITLSDRFIQRLLIEKRSDTEMLAIIAIKCPNIQTIDCRGITKDYEKRVPEVLGILRQYCRHLRDIYCNLDANSRQMMATFGPLVTRIDAINSYKYSKAVTHCHRLSQLRIHSFDKIFDILYDTFFVKNIRKFELISQSYDDDRRWPLFVAANQSIESLAVKSCYFRDEESVREMCGQLSRLTQLRQLTLELTLRSNGQNPAVVTDFLRIIGRNCKQFKRLSLN